MYHIFVSAFSGSVFWLLRPIYSFVISLWFEFQGLNYMRSQCPLRNWLIDMPKSSQQSMKANLVHLHTVVNKDKDNFFSKLFLSGQLAQIIPVFPAFQFTLLAPNYSFSILLIN